MNFTQHSSLYSTHRETEISQVVLKLYIIIMYHNCICGDCSYNSTYRKNFEKCKNGNTVPFVTKCTWMCIIHITALVVRTESFQTVRINVHTQRIRPNSLPFHLQTAKNYFKIILGKSVIHQLSIHSRTTQQTFHSVCTTKCTLT